MRVLGGKLVLAMPGLEASMIPFGDFCRLLERRSVIFYF